METYLEAYPVDQLRWSMEVTPGPVTIMFLGFLMHLLGKLGLRIIRAIKVLGIHILRTLLSKLNLLLWSVEDSIFDCQLALKGRSPTTLLGSLIV